MQITVLCDERAFHETHVCLKGERSIPESRTSSPATNSRQSDETSEIRDLRRLVQTGQRSSRQLGWKMVNENS